VIKFITTNNCSRKKKTKNRKKNYKNKFNLTKCKKEEFYIEIGSKEK